MGKKKSGIKKKVRRKRDITVVNSKAYGPHERSRRGTYTKIKLNKGFKKSNNNLPKANLSAQIIWGAINPHRLNFWDGTMWTRLVSIFQRQMNSDSPQDFSQLKGFEVFKAHPLGRHVQIEVDGLIDEKGMLHFTFQSIGPAIFSGHKEIDQYELKLFVIFAQPARKTAKTQAFNFPLLALNTPLAPFEATLKVPAYTTAALLCVKLEGWIKGYRSENSKTKGMAIVEVFDNS